MTHRRNVVSSALDQKNRYRKKHAPLIERYDRNALFTQEEVEDILYKFYKLEVSNADLTREYKVHWGTISNIIKGRTYKKWSSAWCERTGTVLEE